MNLKEIFGTNVRQHRKARHMSQAELAEAAGLSVDMVGKIERGKSGPSFESIEQLAGALDVPEVALFGTGVWSMPAGERGRILQRIDRHLSRMNEDELSRVEGMLAAFKRS